MPVSFTATRTTNFRPLTGDQDGDGFADAGDVLRHILTIHNTGNTDATAVVLNDLLGGSTETGLMNISPIAFNDAFTAVGNTALRVGGAANIGTGPSSIVAGNLLANDVGSTTVGVGALAADDVTGFTLDTVTNQLTAGGGRFSIFADGSFNYISEAGDVGTDSFTYTIRDAGIDGVAGNSDDTTSTATVTITLTGQVWYVDSAAAGGGTGTSANPFNSITALNTANVDGANDYIYVKGNATGPLVLETGEHLIGQGADLDVAGFHLADDGARSTITNNAAGFAVTLAGGGTGNNEIAGINIVSTGGAGNHGLTGTSFGNLTLNNTTIDASGQALVLSTGGIVAGSTGLVSTDSDGGTNNVSLTTVTGTLALGSGALSGATGTAFNVSGGSVTATYSGNVSQASASQALVSVTGGHTGTLTFSTGTLSATNGTGLQFDNADGNYNFNGTNTLNGGDAGVDIVNGSGGNFSFSTNSAITNATGIAFNVNGGAGNIDYNGTIAHTANTRAISVQNHLGGTVSFDGTVSATGSSDGILLATNTGAIINFTNQLTINAAGANFDASGGGTVTATGSGNVINSGTATALSVANTFIGLGGLNFVSISSSGAANGIVLNTTGTTAGVHGGLTVTGDGGSAVNASGGTISGTTGSGAGISITNARDIVLDQMTIQNGTGDGILGSTIINFSLSNSTVNNNGDALQEHGADLTQVTGNVTFNNVSFTNNETSQVRLINTSGTANVSVTNSDFSSTGLAAAPNGLHGFHMETQGSAAADLMITGTAFDNLFSNSIHTTNEGSGTFEITIATSTFNNVGAGAINIVQNSSGTVRFYVHDNGTFLRGTNTGSSHSININQAGGVPAGAVMEGAISNNVIGNISSSNSANTGGDGIRVLSVGSGTTNVRIDNNNIQGTGANGINVQMSEDTNAAHTMNATIFNNIVSLSHVNNFDGIRVVAGSLVNDAGILRLDMHDNNAGTVAAGNDFTVRQRFATTVQLLNYAGGSTDVAAVQTYLDVTRANNPTGAGNDWFITTQAPGGGFVNTASVPAPTLPTPMLAVSTPPEQAPQENAPKSSGDGTGGGFVTPEGGEPAPAPGQPKVVDDGILSQAELTLIVDAAIDRWAAAGATADQIAAMRAVTFSVENMSGLYLGSSSAGHITLDSNAAGFSWFVDETPGEDSEYSGTGTQLVAPGNTQAGVRMDLLTTVMHELGHQIGLADIYNGDDRDELMYGMANPGERRLPGNDDLTGASGAPVTGIAFILSPINIGTIPAGQIVVVQWDSTVNGYTNQLVPTFTNFSTLSGGNFVNTNSNSETMGPGGANNIILDSLTLGNLIFLDANNNGTFDGADTGINGVALTLFADTNANGVFDSGIDVQLGTTTSAGGGLYSFANLAPGNYIVRVDAANFTGGGALVGRLTATGASDPDDNIDNDDNGANAAGGIVVSQAITLSHDNEPTPGAGNDTNNTLDFGFIELNDPPVNTVPGTQTINEDATLTFTGGTAISINDPDVGAGNLTVTIGVLNGQLTLSGTLGLTFAMGGGDGTDDTTMTFSGTQAAVNAALNGLLYETTLDYNGSDLLTITTSDNGNIGADPGTSGGPTDEQDSDTVIINITAVADVVTDTPTVGEDSGANNLNLLGNDTFENPGRSITSVTQGLHGFVAINDNNTIGDTTDDFVVYTPVADYNGADSFTYTVTSGGVTEIGTVNVTVSAVADITDDAPTVGEDSGTTTIDVIANDSFENGGFSITAVTQGLHGTVTIIDGPDADLNPDYVTYTPNADYNGSDSFTYTVTSGGVTEVATVNVTVTAVADIADDSVGVVQDSGVNNLDLLANDTFESAGRAITAVGAALHGATAINNNGTPGDATDDFVTYTPTGGYTGPDSFTYTVTSGGVTETATVAVNVAPLNLAPVVDLNTGTGGIDDTGLFVEGSVGGAAIGTAIGVTDGDGDPILSATIIITDPETGDLLFANLPLPGGIIIDGASTATMLILTGSASAATYATALGQVGFTSSSDDPTDGGTNPNRVITVTATDAFGTGAAATMTLAIAGVNDEPTLIATGLDPTFPENTAAVDLYSGVTASTVEGGQTITSMTLTVTNVNDGANEILNFDGSTVALTNGNSVVGTATNGLTVNVTVVGSTATVTFTGATLSASALQTLVDALTYRNTAIPPTDGDRVITITQLVDSGSNIGDNDNVSAPNIASTVNVEPDNQAPAVDLDGGTGGVNYLASFTEDGAPISIGSAIAVTDPNSGAGDMIESAIVTLTDRVAGDTLTFTGVVPGGFTIVPTVNPGSIVITITGTGTGAQYATLLGQIEYQTTNQDPTFGGTDPSRTITVTVNDGTLDSAVATTTVTITANDDAPVAQPDAFITDEATAIVSGSVFVANGSGPDADPDGPPLTVSAVNGSGANVGMQITLASGALLTLNANGTFDYDPNGAFDATPTPGSGASNQPAPDSFNYTLSGGNTVTVSISINGLDTNDLLLGTAGSDTLVAGIGNDSLNGGAGADGNYGGTGNDTYFFDSSGDYAIEGTGEGQDIAYTTVSYALNAGSEIEILSALDNGAAGAMDLHGNELDNQLWANNGVNFLSGGGGADILFGFGGGDLLIGGTGADYLDGGAAADALFGSDGDDTLVGGSGNDYMDGGIGADGAYGGTGDDTYFFNSAGDYAVEAAGEGHDVVYTMVSYSLNPGSEVELLSALDNSSLAAINLHGNEFANQIWGTNGANFLSGGGGNDELIGFAGNDLLIGGGGNDYMDGGAGADTFAFVAALGLGNVDTIANYSGAGTDGEDIIALDDAVFAGLGTGPLAANAFTVGTAATTVDHRIIYDNVTGALYFDADGSGAGLAVQFATLQDAPPLTAGDFVVI